MHYQPQINVRDGRVIGFEALLRCNSAVRGMIPPSVFIPILEDNGQIIAVGEWVLHTACRWAASLEYSGKTAPTIAVNISARQFRQADLAHIVATALADSGLSAERLELEITESCLMNVDDQLLTMEQLKHLGVQLSIDDFGTGYSSLSYLKRFPVDRLKIDGSFVRDIEADPDDAVIVTSIIGLARNLDMQVIAEGVETSGQFAFLQAQGCLEIQGYLSHGRCPPMPSRHGGHTGSTKGSAKRCLPSTAARLIRLRSEPAAGQHCQRTVLGEHRTGFGSAVTDRNDLRHCKSTVTEHCMYSGN